MARRSPMNARYQKYQEPQGKTRKSAAAAKPSRKSSTPAAPAKKPARAPLDPPTPEFKRLRTRWWQLLLAGIVLVLVSWGARWLDRPGSVLAARFTVGALNTSWAGLIASITLGAAYVCMFYAIYLDWSIMRPMRKSYLDAQSGKSAKPTKKDTSST